MIKAGIIGLGIGKKHLDAIENYRNSKVVCALEKDRKKIISLKKKYKHIDFYNDEKSFFSRNDVNLISIASYDEFHYSQILKSIKKKWHIIVEKPICLSPAELKKIYYLVKKNKIKITTNLVLRQNNLFLNLKKKINKKEIYYIEADYLWGRKEKLFNWRSKTKNYSLTLGATIHILDLVCWFLNSMPTKVYAKSSSKITKKTKFRKFSFSHYLFTFPKDIMVKLTANAVCTHPHFHTLKIFEKNKTLISDIFGQYLINKKNYKNKFNLKKMKYDYPDKKNRKKIIRDFIDSILDKKIIMPSFKSNIDVMTACFYADMSMKKNKELSIKYLK
tara:strand:- start:13606 stop:14601 length:996 start_codon:yes stop_codon:yes gene_type:complete